MNICKDCELCQICNEKTNKSTRTKIICENINCQTDCNNNNCSKEYVMCRQCCKRWFEDNDKPKCPNCNTEWSNEFLSKIMTKKYINTEFKKKQIKLLLSEEEKYNKFTINLIKLENEIIEKNNLLENIYDNIDSYKKDKIIDFNINKLKDKCSCNNFKIISSLNNYNLINITKCNCKEIYEHFDDIAILNLKSSIGLEKLRISEIEINESIKQINTNIENKSYMYNDNQDINTIIKYCQHNNCKGFLSKDWKCNLCKKETCNKCYEAKDENHKCNEDILKTNKIIFDNKTTKACPKCSIMISKINGCNHMFCTVCKVKYDWKTGKILNTIGFHNPHYFDERNTRERNIRDFPCGGTPVYKKLTHIDKNIKVTKEMLIKYEFTNHILDLITKFCRIYELKIGDRIQTINSTFDDNLDIRKKYLSDEITIEKFGSLLYKRYKSKKKIYESDKYVQNLYYILTDILRNNHSVKNIDSYHKNALECISWIDYYNTLFYNKIHKVYGGVFYNIRIYNNYSGDIYNSINNHIHQTTVKTKEESMISFKDRYYNIADNYMNNSALTIINQVNLYKLFDDQIKIEM